MSKTALVLGGGGAKGAYEIGVIKALKKLNIKYDIITGCSVGSINGAITAQGDYEIAVKLWKNLSTDKVLDLGEYEKNADIKTIIEKGGLDYTNLKKLLEKYIDEEKIRKSPIDFGLVTVKYPEMSPLYIFKDEMEKGKLIDYILGSSAFFPAMKPYEINDKLYIDGGFSDNLPINMAVERGAKRIIAVDLKAIGVIKKPKNKDIKITRISSYYDLGSILDFDVKKSKVNMKLGFLDTLKVFSRLDGFKYTFYKNEISKHFKKIYPSLSSFNNKLLKNTGKAFKAHYLKGITAIFKAEIKEIDKPSYQDLVTFSLENTMEMLDIPYFEIYKLKKAHFLISKKLKACDISDIYQLKDSLLNFNVSGSIVDIIKTVTEAVGNLDKIKLVKLLSENLDLILDKNPKLIIILSICFPKEFFSALYIKFI